MFVTSRILRKVSASQANRFILRKPITAHTILNTVADVLDVSHVKRHCENTGQGSELDPH